MNDYDDDYDYEDDDDDSPGLILSIGNDGKADIHNPEDFVEMSKKDMELVTGFIKENQELFSKYHDKHVEDTKEVTKDD